MNGNIDFNMNGNNYNINNNYANNQFYNIN